MAAVHMPHPVRNHPNAARNAIDAFWAMAIGIIAAYAFFVALGAFSPGDVVGVSLAVAILGALLLLRVWSMRRFHNAMKDPRLIRGRERRGF